MTASAVVVGGGFIGTAVARALAASGRPTTLVTRRPAGSIAPASDGLRAEAIDLRTPTGAAAFGALLTPGIDIVFAAGTSVPAADERDPPASLDPLQPLLAVLGAAAPVPDAAVLFLSSGGAVYGDPDQLPITESHPLRPASAYGAGKVAAETYLGYYARRHGLRTTALRCGNAYGPAQVPGRGQGLVGELLDAARSGRPVEIWGDGSVCRDFVHVDDIAAVVASLCARRDLPLALNVGTGVGTSVREVVDLAGVVVGQPVAVTAGASRSFDVGRVVLDVTRLQDLVGFLPVPLPVGIRRTWAAMVAEPAS